MVSFKRWKLRNQKLLLYTILGTLIIGESIIYFIFAISWNIPAEKSNQDLRVLIISDPQIQVKHLSDSKFHLGLHVEIQAGKC